MENTKISWADHTFNPWIGCAKVDAGCTNCYAEELMDTRYGRVQWGKHGTRVRTKTWRDPMKWQREAERTGNRPRVFCASLCDVFEDWKDGVKTEHGRVPMDGIRHDLFRLIDNTPDLDWMLLTKRPENIWRMWPDDKRRSNVWLGCSVSDHQTKIKAAALVAYRQIVPVLFLSCEPLIGPVNLGILLEGIDWVIGGGESGRGARFCNHEWLVQIRDQCAQKGVAFWMKQLGSNSDILASGKGEKPAEWPNSLRVQELPFDTFNHCGVACNTPGDVE